MAHARSRFQDLVSKAKENIREVTIEQVKSGGDGNERVYVIDVRDSEDWAAGHIPDAIHLPRGKLELDIEQAIPDPSAQIVLYCGGGSRSALATESLQKMGYQNAKSLSGGFRAWRQADLPIE
jgi:rhodanese-related sulfurtransferase